MGRMETRREGDREGGGGGEGGERAKDGDREGRMETGKEGWRQGGKDGDRQEGWRQRGKDGDRQGRMETEREGWGQEGMDGDRQGKMGTMQDHMQMFLLICRILFGCVLDECYCQFIIQTHRLASIQSMHIFDGECDGKYA